MMRWMVFGVVAAALSGCAERHVIRPGQLAVLNDEMSVEGQVRATKVLRFQTAGGQIVDVSPPVVVYITMFDGTELQFCSPLRADFEGDTIMMHHNCGRPQRVQGTEITKVEIEEY